jgi:hypothetical protein
MPGRLSPYMNGLSSKVSEFRWLSIRPVPCIFYSGPDKPANAPALELDDTQPSLDWRATPMLMLKKGGPESRTALLNPNHTYQVSCALIWTMRGEASPPRNDPTMLVGVLTVLMMVPKFGLAISLTGWSKFT